MSYRDDTLTGQELNEREAQMLADHDAGLTDQQLADKYGYASANGAGNVRRRAMTKAGRGDEVRAGSGGGTGSKPKVGNPFEQQIQDTIDRTRATIDQLTTALHEAREQAEVKPADIVKNESARLTERVSKAQADLDAFESQMQDKANRDEFVTKARETASQRLASLENNTQEAIDKAQVELVKMEAALEAVSGLGEPSSE